MPCLFIWMYSYGAHVHKRVGLISSFCSPFPQAHKSEVLYDALLPWLAGCPLAQVIHSSFFFKEFVGLKAQISIVHIGAAVMRCR